MDSLSDSEQESGAPLLAAAPLQEDASAGAYVDWRGRPAHCRPQLGGWKCASCILGAYMLTCLALFGILFNLEVYLVQVCDQTSPAAATLVSTLSGTVFVCSFLGAFLGDAYMGRLWTAVFFESLATLCCALISGAVMIICQGGATTTASYFLFVSLYLLAMTTGSVFPNLSAMGADQLSSVKDKEKYFVLVATLITFGQLLGVTVVTYIDNMGMWVWGFMVSTFASVAVLALTAGAAKFLRQYKVAGNPFLRNLQVLVAACRKWSLNVPKDPSLLYEREGNLSAIPGCSKVQHTASLSFLDKAAVLGSPETFDPWYLCTVTQVEELKSVMRVIPVCIATMAVSLASTQPSTLFEVQALKMNREVATWLVIPAPSLNILCFGSSVLTGVIITITGASIPGWGCGCGKQGRSRKLTSLQLQGVGLVCSIVAMVIAALVESYRLHVAQMGALLSVMWLVPQNVLIGAGMNLVTSGGIDFFYSEVPDGMRSISTALALIFLGAGSYISSILVTIVTDITTKGGQFGWIASDLDKGHLDYFYWLLASCLALTLGVYAIYTWSYKYTRGKEMD